MTLPKLLLLGEEKKWGLVCVKRLDHFVLKESLVDVSTSYKSWVLHNNIYDHFPVALHLDVNPLDTFRPFKFDHSWLKNEDFCHMIRAFWANIICPRNLNVMDIFIFKLKALKEVVSWTKRKNMET